MADQIGTLERLIREFGILLRPLESALTPEELRALLFTDLGVTAPAGALESPGFQNAFGQIAAAAAQLPDAIAALGAAFENGKISGVVQAANQLRQQIQATIAALDVIGGALQNAANTLPGATEQQVRQFAQALPVRLIELLTIYYLDTYIARKEWLILLGIVTRELIPVNHSNADEGFFVREELHTRRIPDLLRSPAAYARTVYNWGEPSFQGQAFLERLAQSLTISHMPAELTHAAPGGTPLLETLLFTLRQDGESTPGLRLALKLPIAAGADIALPVSLTYTIHLTSSGQFDPGLQVLARPPADLSLLTPGNALNGMVQASFVGKNPDPTQLFVLLGQSGGSRIEASEFQLRFGLAVATASGVQAARGSFLAEAIINGGKVVLDTSSADSFLAAFLPDKPIEADLDLGASWTPTDGLRLKGSSGLEISVPINRSFGPLTIQQLYLSSRLDTDSGSVPLEISSTLSGELGPVTVTVDRLGFEAQLRFPDGKGNLGPIDFSIGYKPPNGLGLAIDAGPVTGGGFLRFDPEGQEYAGALELQFGAVGVKAIGLLSTGPGDWSLLLLLYAQIPPIEIGFGFLLEGIGGLIGLQRGVDITALIAGMKTKEFDDILFPADPVGDAPRILNRLRTLFPARAGALTIGPMVDVGWGTPRIVFIRVAVVLQLDNVLGSSGGPVALTRVVLVGQVRVVIGRTDDDSGIPVVLLIVDVVGFWDLADKRFGFLAVLRDSHVAGIDIIGGLGVWGEYGDHTRFLLAAGGFNPRFQDVPAQLSGRLDRLGASFAVGRFSLVLTGYFALTPATIQAGMNLVASATIGPVGVKGEIGFDVLVYRTPRTHFIADFHMTAEVTYHGHTLAGVKVTGTIEGPGQWHLKGEVTFSILWWDISKSFDESWGTAAALETTLVNVLPLLAAELTRRENWSAQLPVGAEAMVTLAPHQGELAPRAHPLGRLVFSQRVVPLGLTLDKYGDSAITGPNHFDLVSVRVGGAVVPESSRTRVREHFARAQFLEMTDEEKLTRPSFEEMDAGVEFSSAAFVISAQPAVGASMGYETAYLDLKTQQIRPDSTVALRTAALEYDLIEALGHHGAAGRAPQRASERMRAKAELRVAVGAPPLAAADRTAFAVDHAIGMGGQASTVQMIAEQRLRTGDAARSQIVEAFELTGA
jgi:hypothetical protein